MKLTKQLSSVNRCFLWDKFGHCNRYSRFRVRFHFNLRRFSRQAAVLREQIPEKTTFTKSSLIRVKIIKVGNRHWGFESQLSTLAWPSSHFNWRQWCSNINMRDLSQLHLYKYIKIGKNHDWVEKITTKSRYEINPFKI